MSMDPQSKRIAEQAAEYVVRRHSETATERRERQAWLAEDARHARAYQEAGRVWERAGELRNVDTLQSLKAADLAALRRPRWSQRRLLLAAATIAMLLGGGLVLWLLTPSSGVRYASPMGERRSARLADGSEMTLNVDSVVEVRYTRGRRSVELERGEAQFEVAHDATRPFVVDMGIGTVTALGTRFQVRRDTQGAVVTLLRGSVAVADGRERRILQPDEQAQISAGADIRVRTIDPALAEGWLEGWLRFRNASLGEVVAEANRYSAQKLRLGDPRLATLMLSGNFRTGDSASIASAIGLVLPVRTEERDGVIVLLPK